MERYATTLLVLLSLGPSAQQTARAQQSSTDARIAAGVSQTTADFQSRLNRLAASATTTTTTKKPYVFGGGHVQVDPSAKNLPTYPAGDLNSILAGTRQELLDSLPPDAAPLRAYVMQNFPTVVTGIPANKQIDMRTCGPYINSANDVLSALKSVSAYRLDLILDSSPAGALFELTPVAGDKLSRASRGTLTNVWRGVYNYTVVKDGEKTITGSVNLVREKGNLLRCTFVSTTAAGPALPCELVAAQ